tara:strand:- start:395 stop:817 length:423 start_codon:yes stop_codon:yes gene_type:complete
MSKNLYKKKTPPMVNAPGPKKKKKKVVKRTPSNPDKPKTRTVRQDNTRTNYQRKMIDMQRKDKVTVKPKPKKKTNPKNKSIMNTPTRQIPKAIKKKVKQKIKNVMNNTPKQNIKKAIFGDSNLYVKMYKKMKTGIKKMTR